MTPTKLIFLHNVITQRSYISFEIIIACVALTPYHLLSAAYYISSNHALYMHLNEYNDRIDIFEISYLKNNYRRFLYAHNACVFSL